MLVVEWSAVDRLRHPNYDCPFETVSSCRPGRVGSIRDMLGSLNTAENPTSQSPKPNYPISGAA